MAHKKLAKCSTHKWCVRNGCSRKYRNMLQTIPEVEEFVPRGVVLLKLPSQAQHQEPAQSKKRKHHTILYKCSEKYQFAKMIKLIACPRPTQLTA